VEAYITTHSDVQFSHSVCPECAKKLYPEYYEEMYPKEDG
jgi:two-component system, response regulator PdtaR